MPSGKDGVGNEGKGSGSSSSGKSSSADFGGYYSATDSGVDFSQSYGGPGGYDASATSGKDDSPAGGGVSEGAGSAGVAGNSGNSGGYDYGGFSGFDAGASSGKSDSPGGSGGYSADGFGGGSSGSDWGGFFSGFDGYGPDVAGGVGVSPTNFVELAPTGTGVSAADFLSNPFGSQMSSMVGTNTKTSREFAIPGAGGVVSNTLSRLGYTDYQIAGIAGRFFAESGLNPNAVNKNDNRNYKGELAHSIGIGQWNGSRQKALKAFAAAKGTDWNDLETQVEFFDHEISTNRDEARARSAMKNAKNADDVVAAMMHYERPKGYTPQNPAGAMAYSETRGYAQEMAQALSASGVTNTDIQYGMLTSLADEITSVTAGKKSLGNPSIGNASVASGTDNIGSNTGIFTGAGNEVAGAGFDYAGNPESVDITGPDGNSITGFETGGIYGPGNESPAASPAEQAITDVAGPASIPGIGPEVTAAPSTASVPDRKGIAGLTKEGITSKELAVGLLSAVTNPIGFLAESIMDMATNGGLPGNQAGTKAAEDRYSKYQRDSPYIPGDGNELIRIAMPAVQQIANAAKDDSFEPLDPTNTANALFEQLYAEMNALSLESSTPPTPSAGREPFHWSRLLVPAKVTV